MEEKQRTGQIIHSRSVNDDTLIGDRIAFKMRLYKGFEAAYKKRHDDLWPDLRELLKSKGISQYTIFLDETTNFLFGIMNAGDLSALKELHAEPVMKRWWHSMKDMMETNDDDSPVSIPLREIFHLP